MIHAPSNQLRIATFAWRKRLEDQSSAAGQQAGVSSIFLDYYSTNHLICCPKKTPPFAPTFQKQNKTHAGRFYATTNGQYSGNWHNGLPGHQVGRGGRTENLKRKALQLPDVDGW